MMTIAEINRLRDQKIAEIKSDITADIQRCCGVHAARTGVINDIRAQVVTSQNYNLEELRKTLDALRSIK